MNYKMVLICMCVLVGYIITNALFDCLVMLLLMHMLMWW